MATQTTYECDTCKKISNEHDFLKGNSTMYHRGLCDLMKYTFKKECCLDCLNIIFDFIQNKILETK